MTTFVPLASTWEAINYLTRLDSLSHLANMWPGETGHSVQWSGVMKEEYIVRLFTALRTSLSRLPEAAQRHQMTSEEFHIALDRIGGAIWRETLSHLRDNEIPMHVAVDLCISLRELGIKLLENASLMGMDQFRVIVFYFDWVLDQVYDVWKVRHEQQHQLSYPAQSADIDIMRAIAESAQSPVDLNPVLQAIVDRVRESGLWSMCAIGIMDPENESIKVPAHSGFVESYPANIQFPAGGSATLETIRRRQPIAISDVYADHDFPVLPEAARAAGYRSILLVPIFIAEMRAAVAFCSREPHDYHEDEITLANAIAQQVIIAIENAHRHQQEKQRVDELKSLNNLIAEQYKLLQRAVSTHTSLTQLVLDEAGLDRIRDAVREILGNPVAIEDEQFQLLNFSEDWDDFDQHRIDSIEAGGTAPALFENPETARLIDDLNTQRRALLLPISPSVGIDKRRIIAPIIAGTEILGYVWVMEALQPFNVQQDLITTEQAALVIALEMMKQRASYETELRLKADFLGDLFSEEEVTDSDLLQRASFLGFSFNKPALLLVIDTDQESWKAIDARKLLDHDRQVISKIQEAVTHLTTENLVANQSGRIVVIVPATIAGMDPAQLPLEVASVIRKSIEQINIGNNIVIGVSDLFQDISDVRRAFLEATRALNAAKSLGQTNETVSLHDLGIYGILFREGDNDSLLNFAASNLAPVVEYDRQNNTELLKTLDTYLNHQTKLAETARKLYIHVNTLRQRIERIESLLNVTLDDPFLILNLQLALRVYDVAPAKHKTH